MLNEVRYFFTAVMFFTRIPIPKWVGYEEHYLQKSKRYFPAVGLLIGALGALVFYLSSLILPNSIAILLSMIATIRATGAFHEDGFADSCDAFGAGWEKEQILTIMKDSRLGTYGTVGLVMILLLKFIALYELAKVNILWMITALVVAHVSSRFVALLSSQFLEYVQDIDKSKSKPIADQKMSFGTMLYSFFWVMASFAYMPQMLWALPVQFLGMLYLNRFYKKKIGGYTGDCLGATQQVCEVLFYLVVLCTLTF